MSLVCTCMSLACHLNVLVCHPYATRIYSYVTRMYLYVTPMSLVCTFMSSVAHSYILLCHPHAICMSLVCGFTMKQIKYRLTRKCFSLAFLELINIKSSTLKVSLNIIEVTQVIKSLSNGMIFHRKKVILKLYSISMKFNDQL